MNWSEASYIVWAIIGVGAVICEVGAWVFHLRIQGIGRLLRLATKARFGQAILLLGWMWLGWHFFAR